MKAAVTRIARQALNWLLLASGVVGILAAPVTPVGFAWMALGSILLVAGAVPIARDRRADRLQREAAAAAAAAGGQA